MKLPFYDLCSFCGGKVAARQVQKPCWWGKELKVIVDRVPAGVCTQCGEIYYQAKILNELEKILKKPARSHGKKKIAVALYPKSS